MGSICRTRTVAINLNGIELLVSGVYTPAVPQTRDYPGDNATFEIDKVEFKSKGDEETHYVEITDLIESFNTITITSSKLAISRFAKGEFNTISIDLWNTIEDKVLEQLENE